MRSSTPYGVTLLVLGVILGWWLANRPLQELDDASRNRLDALDVSTGSVPLVAILLIIVIVMLLIRAGDHLFRWSLFRWSPAR